MDTAQTTGIESIHSRVSSLVEDHMLLMQLKGTKKIAQLIALMAGVLLMAFLGFCILFLVSAIGCYYLIERLGSTYAGLGVITGIYVFLFILLLILRKKYFQTSVANTVIRLLFDTTEKAKANEK